MRSRRRRSVLTSVAVLLAGSAVAQSDTEILFRVNMNARIVQGGFDPAFDTVVVRGALNAWGCSEPMEEAEPGIYELEIQVPGHAPGLAEFKYNINDLTCIDGFWETRDNRLYEVSGSEPDEDGDGFLEIVLDDVFFDDVFVPGLNAELLFRVDMSVQIELGSFDPAVDAPVVSGGFNAWECSEPMVDVGDGIYELEIQVPGHGVGVGEYKFRMSCDDRWEQGANRFYEVIGDEPDEDDDEFVEVVVEPRFFDDNEGGVDVEILFRVDMSVQFALGFFDPGLNSVVVRGGINSWACTDPMEELDDEIYELEVQVPGHILGTVEYKFNIDCGDGGWETRGNRGYVVTGDEPDSDDDGFLEVVLDPPPFFDDIVPTEPVEVDVVFRVDMSVQIARDQFDLEQDTVVVRGDFNAWECSDTFTHAGDGIHELEVERISLVPGPQEYKFNIGCSDDGWEDGDNRSFDVGIDDVVVAVERFFNDDDTAPPFVRGDTNSDGTMNITDSVAALGFLFGGETSTPTCMDALDANDDGGVNITDPILVLNFLFGGGEAPAAPNPGTASYTRDDCGADPTVDSLSCVGVALCAQ